MLVRYRYTSTCKISGSIKLLIKKDHILKKPPDSSYLKMFFLTIKKHFKNKVRCLST